jgi:hypothetical protein
MAQLADQQIGQPESLALRHLDGELIVHHVLVHVGLVAAEQRIAEAGLAHAVEHHLGEDAFELARDFAQRRWIVGTRALAQGGEMLEVVGIDFGIRPHGVAQRSGTCLWT